MLVVDNFLTARHRESQTSARLEPATRLLRLQQRIYSRVPKKDPTMIDPTAVLTDLLKDAAKAGAVRCIKVGARSVRNNVGSVERAYTVEELDARVDLVVTGNGLAQGLIDMKKHIDEVVGRVHDDLTHRIKERIFVPEFRALQQRITETMLRVTSWLEQPGNGLLQEELLSVYMRNDPFAALDNLHTRLTGGPGSDPADCMLDDLVAKCDGDWETFMTWQEHIGLVLSQACTVEQAYIWIKYGVQVNILLRIEQVTLSKVSKTHPKLSIIYLFID